jgi:hypothetical protein
LSSRARIGIAITTAAIGVVVLFLIATGCKYLLNEYESAVSKSETVIPSRSVAEARDRGALVAELTSSPDSLEVDGTVIAVSECWIEQASRPHPHFVWWKKYELLDHYWLNVKLKAGSDLFGDRNRLEVRLSSEGFTQPQWEPAGSAAPSQLVVPSNGSPKLPVLLTVRDRKNQESVGKIEVSSFTLTSK